MAKKVKVVTRTIKFTEATCVTLCLHDNAVSEKVFSVPTVLDGEKLLSVLRETYENDFDKIVAVKSSEAKERLFAIPETMFLTSGIELDPTTRKPINTETQAELDLEDTPDEKVDENPELKPSKKK